MNERQKEMLKILLEYSMEYLSSQHIADQLNCSEKTVRNDSKVLDQWLSEHSNAILSRKPNIGFKLEITDIERNRQLSTLYQTDATSSSEVEEHDRLIRILELLLIEKKAVTLQKLSELFFINKGVVKKDLEKVEAFLHKYQLRLTMKRKLGIEVEGLEQNFRLAISKIPYLLARQASSMGNDFWEQLFEKHEMQEVQLVLEKENQAHANPYTDETLQMLKIHMLIAIKRLKSGHSIELPQSEINRIQQKKEYLLAEKTLKNLEQHFAIRFPVNEIAYLALHFMGGRVQKALSETNELDDEVVIMTAKLINKISTRMQIDFYDDQDLQLGLAVHLQSTVNRIKHGLSVMNPMLDQIKKMYQYMFNTIITELVQLKNELNLHIPEEEAAYLALHFQASIERMEKKRNHQKRVIIVCPMGIAVSGLLRMKLEKKFYLLDIIDTVSVKNIGQFADANLDFIISTVPIPNQTIPVLEVTPLLTAEEEKKLHHFIENLDNHQEKGGTTSLEIAAHGQSSEQFPILRSLLHEELFLLDLNFMHPYEIIEVITTRLAIEGYVDENYIESAIIREQHSATNIGGGIAIPHGDPTLIRKTAIAVGVLKKPILWGNEYVSLVFVLATNQSDFKRTRELFNEMGRLCDHSILTNNLVKQKSAKEFLKLL